MQDLLLFLVKSITSAPDKVSIKEEILPDGTISFKLKVSPEDMGIVIGKGGKIIKSIRSILRIAAIKEGKRVNIELEES